MQLTHTERINDGSDESEISERRDPGERREPPGGRRVRRTQPEETAISHDWARRRLDLYGEVERSLREGIAGALQTAATIRADVERDAEAYLARLAGERERLSAELSDLDRPAPGGGGGADRAPAGDRGHPRRPAPGRGGGDRAPAPSGEAEIARLRQEAEEELAALRREAEEETARLRSTTQGEIDTHGAGGGEPGAPRWPPRCGPSRSRWPRSRA